MSEAAPGTLAGVEGLVAVLLARWEVRAWLQDALEAEARARLAGVMTDDALEIFLEQQLATEQAEFVAEFFWVLHAKGCEAPGRMAEWIDCHNALVDRLLAQLDRRNAPLGPRHKRRLWRLKAARFGAKAKAACCARLDGSGVVLSLRDLERFMALHMDVTLCRDRLDALARAGLLEDAPGSNLRLFRATGRLEAIVAAELGMLRERLLALGHGPPDGGGHL
jgi:hypothetical protein